MAQPDWAPFPRNTTHSDFMDLKNLSGGGINNNKLIMHGPTRRVHLGCKQTSIDMSEDEGWATLLDETSTKVHGHLIADDRVVLMSSQLQEPHRINIRYGVETEDTIVIHSIGLKCRLYTWSQEHSDLVEVSDGSLEIFKQGHRGQIEEFFVSFMSSGRKKYPEDSEADGSDSASSESDVE